MRILFWNTGRRPVVELLRDVCRRRDLDVLVLAEIAGPVGDVVAQLNQDAEHAYFSAHDRLSNAVKRPLHVLTRLPDGNVKALRDSAGITVKQVFPIIGPDFTIVAVHLRSKLFQDQDDQASRARSFSMRIEAIEGQVGHRRTLVIGDFNTKSLRARTGEFRLFSRSDVAKDGATTIAQLRRPRAKVLLQPDVESFRRPSSESSWVIPSRGLRANRVFLALVRPGLASAGFARVLCGRRP